VTIETENREIRRFIVGGVFVDVVNVERPSFLRAEATGAVCTVAQKRNDVLGYGYPLSFHE
jgi:hypothetical protein